MTNITANPEHLIEHYRGKFHEAENNYALAVSAVRQLSDANVELQRKIDQMQTQSKIAQAQNELAAPIENADL